MTFVIVAIVMALISYTLVFCGDLYGVKLIQKASKFVSRNSSYITFMFTGTTLYYMISKQWQYTLGVATLLLLLFVNYLCLSINPENKGVADLIFANHLYVMVFFSGLYFANNYIPYSKILNKIADISYPLYLTHGFTGYALYFASYRVTESIPLSVIAAFSTVLMLVFLIHYKVEKPGIALSKTIIENHNNQRSLVSVTA